MPYLLTNTVHSLRVLGRLRPRARAKAETVAFTAASVTSSAEPAAVAAASVASSALTAPLAAASVAATTLTATRGREKFGSFISILWLIFVPRGLGDVR